MPHRPAAVFALSDRARREAFPAPVLDRLCRLVHLDPATAFTEFTSPQARAALADAEILISGWGAPRIDRHVLAAAPRLRAIVHAAGTVKLHLDEAVFEQGIVVSSAAQANATPVAEFTVAALTLGAKDVFARARRYAGSRPGDGWPAGRGPGLLGATVGIIGASRVGRLVLERLRELDITVLLADPYITADQARALGAELTDLDALCGNSELVSLHAPALPETRHLLDARRLALLPDGALLINTARGSLVDTGALIQQCATGRISAVLDVTDPEPLPAGHPLFALDNVFVTPHLAGAEGREVCRLGEFATAEIARFLNGAPLHGQVHLDHLARIA
ncbi:phosphoglycerate dehydrogenase-like enzyme [Actinoplanes lutulentus]|uniref:Phosphoglycerate dehydrogenase-like enzyme n=1 Tax=Actinoplanes lutulentus TaxID=1287878 RepID=A0A327ZC85_9ACTN|nr:hydroxyacid dehydrogenase [Actinoplanes lutulentus]MBB2947290.1 phosphoglycerate dehydrogenase-like enzyme [Actinoplanes lutulentus]RAK36565.1 phosphoglycerate dehydrogenase-like enzyme [Actinoplanes lutulentus]